MSGLTERDVISLFIRRTLLMHTSAGQNQPRAVKHT
jgi:hypothetical protein